MCRKNTFFLNENANKDYTIHMVFANIYFQKYDQIFYKILMEKLKWTIKYFCRKTSLIFVEHQIFVYYIKMGFLFTVSCGC